MALPTMTISGSNPSTESMLSGPRPPQRDAKAAPVHLGDGLDMCGRLSPAARASDGR